MVLSQRYFSRDFYVICVTLLFFILCFFSPILLSVDDKGGQKSRKTGHIDRGAK